MQQVCALVRKPDESFVQAISRDKRKIDLRKAFFQHQQYVDALLKIGIDVDILEIPESKDPDGVFIEDTAIVLPGARLVVITNPKPESRKKELAPVVDFFSSQDHFCLSYIHSPANLEGGDVLRAGRIFFVGISGRTTKEGYEQFREIIGGYPCKSYKVYPIEVPPDALHLKSIVTYCGEKNGTHVFLCRDKNEVSEIERYLSPCDFIETAEKDGANVLAINETCFVPAHCMETKRKLFEYGFSVQSLDISEFAYKDGSLTCLALFFLTNNEVQPR